MELDERKFKILQAIIRNYLETGEPVGSRTISKYTDLNLSSATIRNEMADLEELGYIVQPHTSAGRIPSDKGYRLYVDHMMKEKEEVLSDKEKEVDEMKEFLIDKVDKVEELLQNVAKVLASNTNYATMISTPQMNRNKLKFIQLTMVEATKILAVIVMDGNIIRNRMIEVEEELDNEIILKLNLLLNTSLSGLTLDEINLTTISKLKNQAGEYNGIVNRIIDALAEVISGEDDVKIYTSGTTNIFKYPELSDSAKASELICTLEEKQVLSELITSSLNEGEEGKGTGIQVYIGNETPINTMKDCSVVTATYELGDGMKGAIGIIGPKRMDYEKVVESLKTLKTQLDSVYKK
ncbi:MAG: heat-inducible transcriptional repressor HrcA [Lachnospiraceae bacterium]